MQFQKFFHMKIDEWINNTPAHSKHILHTLFESEFFEHNQDWNDFPMDGKSCLCRISISLKSKKKKQNKYFEN